MIPLIIAIIVTVILECREYGKKQVFCFSKKGTPADRKDIFLKSLQSQINSQVFITDRDSKMIVIVNSNGTYLYSFLQEDGILFEKEDDWYLKEGKEERKIKNPIKELKKEENLIEEEIGISLYSCVVLDSYTYFQKGNKKYPLLRVSNAPFYLCRTDLLRKLTDKEIERVVKTLTTKLEYRNFLEKEDGEDLC